MSSIYTLILFCQLPSRSARRKKAKRRWLRELKLENEKKEKKVIWFCNATVDVFMEIGSYEQCC